MIPIPLGAIRATHAGAVYSPDMTTFEYNYDRFDRYVDSGAELAEFLAFPNHLHAGDPAPEASLIRLDDESEIRLSDLWADHNVVLEFGSFT